MVQDRNVAPGYWHPFAISMLGLLIAEVLLASVLYDGRLLDPLSDWATRRSSQLVNVAITALAATLVFGNGPKGLADLLVLASSRRRTRGWLLLLHFTAFGGFLVATYTLYTGSSVPKVACWLCAALLSLACWAIALAPTDAWRTLVNRYSPTLLCAAVVGLASFIVAELTQRLWLPLDAWTLASVNLVLRQLPLEVVSDPQAYLLGTDRFAVSIRTECSGYEGVGLIWGFVGMYLWHARASLRFPRAWFVLLAATLVAWIANALRITLLILVGHLVSADLALGGFHSKAGWIAFNLIALGSVLMASRAQYFSKERQSDFRNPASPWLAPWCVWLAITLVTGAFALPGRPDFFYPLKVFAAVPVLFLFRDTYRRFTISWSWQPIAVGMTVAGLWVLFVPAPETSDSMLWLELGTGRKALLLYGAWSICRVFGYTLLVPLIEELAFRGFLLRRLIATNVNDVPLGQFSWLSLVVSSVLFGALHGSNWLPATLAGAAFAIVLYRRGNIWDSVIAHGVANTSLAVVAVATGQWHLWS